MNLSRTAAVVSLLTIVGGSVLTAGIASAATVSDPANVGAASAPALVAAASPSTTAAPTPSSVVGKTGRGCTAAVPATPSTGRGTTTAIPVSKDCAAALAAARRAAEQQAAAEKTAAQKAAAARAQAAKRQSEVTVQPKGAPETGGGGLAAIVSTWG